MMFSTRSNRTQTGNISAGPRLTALAAFFGVLVASSGTACKNESSTSLTQTYLTPPSVFLPVGVLRQPRGIAVDGAGDVWVADTRAGKVRRLTRDGVLRDSIIGFQLPAAMGFDRSSGSLLLVDEYTLYRLQPQTGAATIIATLTNNSIDTSAVFDIDARRMIATAVNVARLGDITAGPMGDVYVGCFGTPENFLVRVRAGLAAAVAASFLVPTNSAERGPHFVGVDAFGTVFSSFAVGGATPVVRFFAFSPSHTDLSRVLTEPAVTGAARGSTIDVSGNLYVTDPATQELVIVSTIAERTIARYVIPDVGGYSMIPHDVAVSEDGRVYVVVSDRLGTEAGAILVYRTTKR